MLFSLLHAFLLFACVVLLVRLTMPARYALLNPYAAMLDSLVTRGLDKLKPAFPLPTKTLCGLLLVLFLCADAVMLSRLQMSRIVVGALAAFQLPNTTFVHWLWIAVYGLGRHLLTLLAATLFFTLWHRSKQLPGYSGDLLRLSVHPIVRLPLTVQILTLCLGATLLTASLFVTATGVVYPMEQMPLMESTMGEVAPYFAVSRMTAPFQLAALSGASILEIFGELYGFTFTLLFIALISSFTRSQGMVTFLDDVFRLLRGPLPVVRLGRLNLTPLLALFVFFLLSGFTTLIVLLIVAGIATLAGGYVV